MKNLVFASAFALSATVSSADPGLTLFSSGYERPIDMAAASAYPDILFVAEQHGVITAIDADTGDKKYQVLDISERVSRKHNEQGLLGLAISPTAKSDGYFYVNYTDKDMTTHISRFRISAKTGIADPDDEQKMLSFKQDYGNHNGGWMAFGPDGYLYIGIGDGGSGNDPKHRGQDLTNILGSIARIDVSSQEMKIPSDNPFVDSGSARPEIYAYGLRNPWRCSFDRKTGDLWIADVGQNAHEEINFAAAGEARGVNYGWRLREAMHPTPKKKIGGQAPAGAVDPIYEYDHGQGGSKGKSVTGGYVYRGSVDELTGQYLFADYVSHRIWGITQKNGKLGKFTDYTDQFKPDKGQLGPISSFAEDANGELYIIDHSGPIYRIDDK